jgi:hypothetical protein
MACKCKEVKKLKKMLEIETPSHEKRGLEKVLAWIWNIVKNLLIKVGVTVVILCLAPVVALFLIASLLFEGKATIHLPKKFFKAAVAQSEAEEEE